MSTFNQPMTPSGHPVFAPRDSGFHEVSPQHVPVATPSQGVPSLKLSPPSLSLSMTCEEASQRAGATLFAQSQGDFNRQHLRNTRLVGTEYRSNSSDHPPMRIMNPEHCRTTTFDSELQPLAQSMKSSLLQTGNFNLPEKNCGFQSSVVLTVVIYSALKLENKQIDLIARKMRRLTGFRNLKLENITDPSLIAGFVISYDADGSQVIDLSVKGQLAALTARVESTDKRDRPL
ncbi:hypothetical protein J5N97_018471 [Dioscorea zingiberensis]|uniref:ATP synthase delta chain n=1 Tax=Dioscorea zingiberensis TaxID=325984 RepID=A0A9D5CN54_9LILI|nr:hypothetical protein J5N97_018471 [Dioscorea zingiberensis]